MSSATLPTARWRISNSSAVAYAFGRRKQRANPASGRLTAGPAEAPFGVERGRLDLPQPLGEEGGQLGEVDVTGVEPMTAVIENHLRLRDDVIDADPLTGGGKRDDVLANAPAAEHGFFGVPKVIE